MEVSVSYRLDASDRIVHVDSEWDAFALSNGATRLQGDLVRGRWIWDLISDPDVQRLYAPLFRSVRERSMPVSFPFRCDAPNAKRFMRMRVVPQSDSGLLIESVVERVEARAFDPLYRQRLLGMAQMVQFCSHCNCVATPEGWLELQAGIGEVLATAEFPVRVSYSYCPDCRAQLFDLASGARPC